MKFIKELLENSSEGAGLGYYIIDDYENAAVDGPFKTKTEAQTNRSKYYKGDDRTTFSIHYGTVSNNGHFTAAKEADYVSEGGMPSSVIKHKQKIAMMSNAEIKAYFSTKTKEAAERMERSHVVKPGTYSRYVDGVVKESAEIQLWTADSGNFDVHHPERHYSIGFFRTKYEAEAALAKNSHRKTMNGVHSVRGPESWLKEDAAGGSVGAGSIAGSRGSLFGGPVVKRKIPKSERVQKIKFTNRANWNLRESFMARLLEDTSQFNSADVISKLTGAEKQNKFNTNSVAFGIEDEEGNVVKVYVVPEQADDFEKVLGGTVADTAMNSKEIAEILFNLKNQFDIVHVEWPPLPEDEEEDVALTDTNDIGGDLEMTDGAEGGENLGTPELPADTGEDDNSVKSALDKVIDMLKADAEARKAEADAKGQESKAKEAEYAAKMAEQKVKSEEEVLDMETFYKNKNDERKEAQKLIKLAKYRHDLASSAEEDLN